MGKFGSGKQPIVGHTGFCSQCRNKAEVKTYPGDNPDPICGDCYNENLKLERFIQDKQDASIVSTNGQTNLASSKTIPEILENERERYIKCIKEKANATWIDNFITEVVAKQILRFDFDQVLRNERWFTVLDLRRHALSIDPRIDNPSEPKQYSPAITAMRKAKETKRIERERGQKK